MEGAEWPTALGRIIEEQGRQPQWVAARVGVSRQMLWFWRTARKRPPAWRREMLADALDVEVADLFTNDGELRP